MTDLSLAAKFPASGMAQHSYRAVTRTLARHNLPISAYRLDQPSGHYIALVGEEERLEVWQGLVELMRRSGGEVVVMDEATIDGLLALRRADVTPP
jgi:hypothetical protein